MTAKALRESATPATPAAPVAPHLALAHYYPRDVLSLNRFLPKKLAQTKYSLKDGDEVQLTEHAPVDGYWYDEQYAPCGNWQRCVVLAGAKGRVVHARTPWVQSPEGRARYFANIDVTMANGEVLRVRMPHGALRRLTGKQRARADQATRENASALARAQT